VGIEMGEGVVVKVDGWVGVRTCVGLCDCVSL